ncbi:Tub family protein, partial [Reticulomyxa filosa]
LFEKLQNNFSSGNLKHNANKRPMSADHIRHYHENAFPQRFFYKYNNTSKKNCSMALLIHTVTKINEQIKYVCSKSNTPSTNNVFAIGKTQSVFEGFTEQNENNDIKKQPQQRWINDSLPLSEPPESTASSTPTFQQSKTSAFNYVRQNDGELLEEIPKTKTMDTVKNIENIPKETQSQARLSIERRKNENTNLKVDFDNLFNWLKTPIPCNTTFQTQIKRNKSRLNRLYPKYEVFSKDQGKLLMCASKQPKNKTSNYIIGINFNDQLKQKNEQPSPYLGKLRSNFMGTHFVIYDDGRNPKDLCQNQTPTRKEIGAVVYDQNILGTKGPRKMTVLLPDPQTNKSWQPIDSSCLLIEKYTQQIKDGILCLQNRTPKWNYRFVFFSISFKEKLMTLTWLLNRDWGLRVEL